MIDAEAYQSIVVSSFREYCEANRARGRCWKHKAPMRNCNCDAGVYLDMEHLRKRQLRRAGAYGRLLAMRRNKAFWTAFMAAGSSTQPPSRA